MDTIFELKQRMALLERAHASARMGHFVIDPKRQTIEFSSWVRDNIGLNDMPIPLDRLSEIIPETEREAFEKTVAEVIEREEDFTFETNVVTAKGLVRTQRVSGITAFENPNKREGLIGFFGILQEVTHEKAAQLELREAHDAAQAQLVSRSNLLAVVSHEIRTPLGGILGILDQLKRERSAAERDRALQLIEDSCEVLLDTLDAILQQERIDKDAKNIATMSFRPSSVAHRVAELFRPLARRKGLRIEVNAPSDAEAVGDPARLQQVLANFVSNGVKFTQSGAITIYVQQPMPGGAEWVFVVSDTGPGIEENRMSTLFKPFSDSAEDSLGRSVGAGLGLSITRDLVSALGGSIEVESEVGRGSSFTVKVPMDPAPEDETNRAPVASKGSMLVMVERASDQVQAEAIASQFGLEPKGFDPLEDVSDVVLVLTDTDKLGHVTEKVLAQCKTVVVLITDGAPLSIGGSAAEEFREKIIEVSSTQISRTLPEVIEGIIHASDG